MGEWDKASSKEATLCVTAWSVECCSMVRELSVVWGGLCLGSEVARQDWRCDHGWARASAYRLLSECICVSSFPPGSLQDKNHSMYATLHSYTDLLLYTTHSPLWFGQFVDLSPSLGGGIISKGEEYRLLNETESWPTSSVGLPASLPHSTSHTDRQLLCALLSLSPFAA